MSRTIATTLLLGLLTPSPAWVMPVQAADVEARPGAREQRAAESQKVERPRLALVVSGARGSAARLHKGELSRALEQSLGVQVSAGAEGSSTSGLGMLSVMVSDARTTLLWTLPDGRSGIVNLRTETAGRELHTQVVAAAQRMLSRLGTTSYEPLITGADGDRVAAREQAGPLPPPPGPRARRCANAGGSG